MEIITSNGVHEVKIKRFAALDGWDIQSKFVNFALTQDKEFRRAFTLEILSYAVVITGDREIPLITDALIDNHLENWQNIQSVFETVLLENGIDPATHANRPDYWSEAGAQMAAAFIASCNKMIGPAMEHIQARIAESQ